MLDSYNKYKKETQVIVGISAIPIGRIRITNQVLAGRAPMPLSHCVIEEGNLMPAIEIERTKNSAKKNSVEDYDPLDQRAYWRTFISSPENLFIPLYLCI